MDEKEFKKTLRTVNERPCVFEKSILTGGAGCERACRQNIAERETVGCDHEPAHADCVALLAVARDKAAFALGTSDHTGALPHAKALRLQMGTLTALAAALAAEQSRDEPRLGNIRELVEQAQARYRNLEALPFPLIIRHVASFKGRRRPRRSR